MTTFCSLTAWQWDEPLLHLGILFKRLIFCNKELKLTTYSQPVINKRDWGPPALSAHLMPTSKFCIWGTLEIMTTPPCSRKKSKYELMIVWSSETEQNRTDLRLQSDLPALWWLQSSNLLGADSRFVGTSHLFVDKLYLSIGFCHVCQNLSKSHFCVVILVCVS